jgi:hypothetical protein
MSHAPRTIWTDAMVRRKQNTVRWNQTAIQLFTGCPEMNEPTLILDEGGMLIIKQCEGATMPANYSFKCINNFVNCESPQYEDLQNLALGMSSHIEALLKENERLREDGKMLDFITDFESYWSVWPEKRGNKPVTYRMRDDGEWWGKRHASAREAIRAALKGGAA